MASSRSEYSKDRGGTAEPLQLWRWVHLRVFWMRLLGIIKERIMWLSGDCASMPLDRWCHPLVFKNWSGFLFRYVAKSIAVDTPNREWYPRRVRLVLTTRMQYLFRGVRYSKWVLNRSEYFLRPWPLKRRQSK